MLLPRKLATAIIVLLSMLLMGTIGFQREMGDVH